jgi:hypothetical protein
MAVLPVPLDGRLTSLPSLTTVVGGELMEITAPGNAQYGNSYKVTVDALATYFRVPGPQGPAGVQGPVGPPGPQGTQGPPPASTMPPFMDSGTIGVPGSAATYSPGDHIHPSDTSRAALSGAAFTGTVTAPTPTAGDSSTKVATTAFVSSAIAAMPLTSLAPQSVTGTSATITSQSATIAATGTCTLTLPTPSSNVGNWLYFVSTTAQIVQSASANVIPLAGGAAGTAIFTAAIPHWCIMQSNGTNWITFAAV